MGRDYSLDRQHNQLADVRPRHIQAGHLITPLIKMQQDLPDKAPLVIGIDRKDSLVRSVGFLHDFDKIKKPPGISGRLMICFVSFKTISGHSRNFENKNDNHNNYCANDIAICFVGYHRPQGKKIATHIKIYNLPTGSK